MSDLYVRPKDLHILAPNGECEELNCINVSKLQRESAEHRAAFVAGWQAFGDDEFALCQDAYKNWLRLLVNKDPIERLTAENESLVAAEACAQYALEEALAAVDKGDTG